jgi:peptidoglycan hydrolase-like protein with peptidoglycan-binding domain
MSARALGRWSLIAIVVLLVGAVAGWSLREMLSPPPDTVDDNETVLVEVAQGEVGLSLNLSASVQWDIVSVHSNQANGILTGVNVTPGDVVAPGQVLYTVNLQPVVAASGVIPAFRDLAPGTRGEDVRQLQGLLVGLGHLEGPPDGDYGPQTARAVREWQRARGVFVTGAVAWGDLMFVPDLPARLATVSDATVGSVMSVGQPFVQRLSAQPKLSMTVTEGQNELVPTGARVRIFAGDEEWETTTGDREVGGTGDGTVTIALESGDAENLCHAGCEDVPVGDAVLFDALVEAIPEVSGSVVPSASISTGADNRPFVLLPDGRRRVVTVVASAQGSSVVTGVKPGEMVRAAPNA